MTNNGTSTTLTEVATREGIADAVARTILDFLSNIPSTDEREATNPEDRARYIGHKAALKASALAGALALPPGPLGIATILPDLVGVWKIQAQMVADIAGAYGKTGVLSQEQMLYCLFKHAAAQVIRDLVVRTGGRMLVRRVTLRVLQNIAQKIGITVTQRTLAKAVLRWLPIAGAIGVGAYAYYDTAQVAATARELFSGKLDIEEPHEKAAV